MRRGASWSGGARSPGHRSVSLGWSCGWARHHSWVTEPLSSGDRPVGARPAGAPWLVEDCPAPDRVKSEFLVLPVGALGGLCSAWLGEAPAPAQTCSPGSVLGALNAHGQCPPDSRPPASPASAPLRPLLALCPSPSLLPPMSLALLCQLRPQLPGGRWAASSTQARPPCASAALSEAPLAWKTVCVPGTRAAPWGPASSAAFQAGGAL